jgi:hypothetical protein
MIENNQRGSDMMSIQQKAIEEFAAGYQRFLGEITCHLFLSVFCAEYMSATKTLTNAMIESYGAPVSEAERAKLQSSVTISYSFTNEGSNDLTYQTLEAMYHSGAMDMEHFHATALGMFNLDQTLAVKGEEELEERQKEEEEALLQAQAQSGVPKANVAAGKQPAPKRPGSDK